MRVVRVRGTPREEEWEKKAFSSYRMVSQSAEWIPEETSGGEAK
jgi:hypothetical protein